jgi:hypothetical protein
MKSKAIRLPLDGSPDQRRLHRSALCLGHDLFDLCKRLWLVSAELESPLVLDSESPGSRHAGHLGK